VRRRTRSHWSGGVLATVLACALCAGIAVTIVVVTRSSPFPAGSASAQTRAPGVDRAALAAAVTFDPQPGANGVALDAPIAVATRSGYLFSVRVTTSAGAPVAGMLTSANAWRSTTRLLRPDTDYRITATASAASGEHVQSTSRFRTLTPSANVAATIFPDGLTVGVAQPVVIRFDHYITNPLSRAAVLSHFTVTESHPVPGGWHWFSNNELHFRPKSFWPTGEKVTVTSDLEGWSAGEGLWGSGHVTVSFTVGPSHVSVVNLATNRMTVSDNGKVIANYPFSGGRTTDPTMNGTHIVLDRQSVVRMISSSNGVPVNSPDGYDELVYYDVHITDSGEYVHAAPWSVQSQGHTNVSHGCVNLSNADALTFFGFSRVGDVVMVVGGPRPPELGDHGVMDWDTPWKQWTPGPVRSVSVSHPRTTHRAVTAVTAS
jgi:lipoprotein-anchoring transpeptidase ErfK/SrfK